MRNWSQGAGAADLNLDVLEHGLRAFGGELMGDAPARSSADEAEAALPVETIDLVDHAVDVERQVGALVIQGHVNFERIIDRFAQLRLRRNRKAPALQLLQ